MATAVSVQLVIVVVGFPSLLFSCPSFPLPLPALAVSPQRTAENIEPGGGGGGGRGRVASTVEPIGFPAEPPRWALIGWR